MRENTQAWRAIRAIWFIGLTICLLPAGIGQAEPVSPTPPALHVLRATGSATLREVTITFDQVIDPSLAIDLFNYSSPHLGEPEDAKVNPDGQSVTVRFSNPQTPGARYTVNVQSVTTLAGGPLEPPSADATFDAFVFRSGNLRFAIYDGLGGGVVGPPPFGLPPPSAELLLPAFDTRTVLPTDSRENYLGRIDGFFIPPSSGDWVFFLRSDDSSELWLDLDDGYGPAKVVEEPDCCGTIEQHPSAPLALTAGKLYRMIGVYRERSGTDYMQVAAKLESDPTPPDQLPPIAGAMIGIYADPIPQPPTAKIATDALVDFGPDFEHPVLISCNWWNACLKLDASRSSDLNGESLEFAWFVDDAAVPFSDAIQTMPCFEVGVHQVTLVVTDSTGASATDRVTFEVVTAPLAVELLLEEVNQSQVSRPTKRQLAALLRKALTESKRSGGRPDQRTLDAFESKVVSEIAARWPDVAMKWILWSQAISGGMEKCIKIPRFKGVESTK